LVSKIDKSCSIETPTPSVHLQAAFEPEIWPEQIPIPRPTGQSRGPPANS
jgi:hypothetical protein